MKQGDKIHIEGKEYQCVEIKPKHLVISDGETFYDVPNEKVRDIKNYIIDQEDRRFCVSMATVYISIICMTIRNLTMPQGKEPAFITTTMLPNFMQTPMELIVKGSKEIVKRLQNNKAYFNEMEQTMTTEAATRLNFSAYIQEVQMSVVDKDKLTAMQKDIIAAINKHLPNAITEVE